MLLPGAAGITNGKLKNTRQKSVHPSSTRLAAIPQFPSQNGPRLILDRPRTRRHITGIEYEKYRKVMQPVIMLELQGKL